MPEASPGFWAGMYTWWNHSDPLPPQRLLSQVGSCPYVSGLPLASLVGLSRSWLSAGTKVLSWMTSGRVSAAPGIKPSVMSFCSASSAMT